MKEPCAAGVGVIEVRRALIDAVGLVTFETALASLPADIRDEYTQMTPLGWVRLSTSSAVIDAVAREARRDAEVLYDQVIRTSIERSFKTVWRVLLHFTTDEALIARTPTIYAKSRDTGRLVSKITAPGRAEAVLSGWPDMHDRHMRSIELSMLSVLELAGRREVRGVHHRTADGAVFRLTWRV